MKKREIGRLFPILIALFLLTSLASAFLVFFLWKTPDNQQFEESFLAAEVAAAENQRFLSNRALIRASRHAISVKHWKQILGLSAQKLPMAPTTRDYRLFVKLAGRAASGVAGNQDFAAYLVWGELRSGKIRRAEKALDGLSLSAWPSLQAEVRIAAYLSDNDQSLEDFYLELESKSDAEFFEQVAELTRSAALTVDAALAYMEIGQPAKALELSQEALSGNRWWGNPRTPYYRGIFTGLSRIAYDAADTGTAVTWLEMGLADARERRAVFWEDLQFLGDIFWEKHRTQARADYLIKARELWYEALDTVYPESSASPPEDSWKIWLSLSVLEGSAGNNRQSEELLRDALILFPDRSEVKAAWARKHADTNPGLARRLVRNGADQEADPVLAIAAMQVDPKSVSPRLYEARLWQLFDKVAKDDMSLHPVDARVITTFLLEYLSSRKDYSSVDIVVDRYRKIHPEEAWILSWRLAADASRRISIIDLVAPQPGAPAPYDEFRQFIRGERSWRGLHDAALFAFMASQELLSIASEITEEPTFVDRGLYDPILIDSLKEKKNDYRTAEKPLGDRLDLLFDARTGEKKTLKLLLSGGRKGRDVRAISKATLLSEAKTLHSNSLEDLQLALDTPDLPNTEKANLFYLQAAILKYLGRFDAMNQVIALALETDPANPRIRALRSDEAPR